MSPEKPDLLVSQARRGFWLLASSQLLWQVLSWGLTIITMRFLTPADYGLMAIIGSLTPYLVLAATLDLGTWIVQEQEMNSGKIKAIFTLTLLMGILITLLGLMAAPLVASFFDTPEVVLPLVLVSITFLASGISTVPEALLRRELNFKPLALINLFVGVSMGLLQLLLAYLGFAYWALVIGYVYRSLARFILLLWVRRISLSFSWDTGIFLSALRFGVPSAASAVLWILYSTVDNVFVGKYFGTEILGLYSMAFYLMDMPLSKLNASLKPVLLSYFSKLKSSTELLRERFMLTVTSLVMVIFPIVLGIAVVAEDLVAIFFGEEWTGIVLPLRIMAVVGVLRALLNNVSPLFLSLGKPKYDLIGNFFGVLIFPVLVITLGINFGINGVYASWLLFQPLLALLVLSILRYETGISIYNYLRSIAVPLFASVLMLIVCHYSGAYFSFGSVWLSFLFKALLGAVFYFSIIYLFYAKKSLRMISSFGIME